MFDWFKRKTEEDYRSAQTTRDTALPVATAPAVDVDFKTVEAVIPLVREDVFVDKRTVEGDRVRVDVQTVTETHAIEEDLLVDAVNVERVPVDRPLTEIPEIVQEGDVTIVPIVRERLVLKKELVLVEEVRITRRRNQQTVRRDIDVRRQEPRIVRTGADGTRTQQTTEITS